MPGYCSNCGIPLREGVKFCTNCGTPVANNAQTNTQNETNRTFKPVFYQNNDVQQNPVETPQQPVDTYQQPMESPDTTETFQQTVETNQQQIYETAQSDTSNINSTYEENTQEATKPEKKYFGVKNIFLFLLNVAAVVTFFLGGLIIKILPSTEFVDMENGAEASISLGKAFLYALQTAFGFGKFNTGIELIDQALTDTSLLFKEATDSATTTMSLLTKVVGGIGALFVVLAILAAIISLIKLIKRKRGRSSNVVSLFSSVIGLLIGVALIVIVLLLKDSILGSLSAPEGYMSVPFDLSLDMFTYIFTGICLLLLIISIVTMKK